MSGSRIIVRLITSSLLEPWNLPAPGLSYCSLNVRYAHFIDGDTESLKKVLESKLYRDDLIPCKLECVGHVKKRLERGYESYEMTLWGKN